MPAQEHEIKAGQKQPGEALHAALKMTLQIIFFIIVGCCAAILFYFGFINPDPSDCFYVRGLDLPDR